MYLMFIRHLMMEAINGFIIVLTVREGKILYVSEGITSLLGYVSTDLVNTNLYDIISNNDKKTLYNTLLASTQSHGFEPETSRTEFLLQVKRGVSKEFLESESNDTESVKFSGFYRYAFEECSNLQKLG